MCLIGSLREHGNITKFLCDIILVNWTEPSHLCPKPQSEFLQALLGVLINQCGWNPECIFLVASHLPHRERETSFHCRVQQSPLHAGTLFQIKLKRVVYCLVKSGFKVCYSSEWEGLGHDSGRSLQHACLWKGSIACLWKGSTACLWEGSTVRL